MAECRDNVVRVIAYSIQYVSMFLKGEGKGGTRGHGEGKNSRRINITPLHINSPIVPQPIRDRLVHAIVVSRGIYDALIASCWYDTIAIGFEFQTCGS